MKDVLDWNWEQPEENYQPSELFMQVSEVKEFIGSYIAGRHGGYDFRNSLDSLRAKRDHAKQIEDAFFQKLQLDPAQFYDNFADFAKKPQMFQFSTDALRASQDFTTIKSAGTNQLIQKAVIDFLKKDPVAIAQFTEQFKADGLDVFNQIFSNEASSLAASQIIISHYKNTDYKRGKYLKPTALAAALRRSLEKQSSIDLSRTAYNKIFVDIVGGKENLTEARYTFEARVPKEGGPARGYPYYRLDKNAQQAARADVVTWTAFQDKLREIAQYDGSKPDAIEAALAQFTIDDFFVNNLQELKGVFGELQAMLIIGQLVGAEKLAQFRYIANEMVNGQKAGADIILQDVLNHEGAGIQVKNYQTFSSSSGLSIWNMHDKITFDTFKKRADNQLDVQSLSTYLAFRQYNQPLKEANWGDLSAYTSMYEKTTQPKSAAEMLSRVIVGSQFDAFYVLTQQLKNKQVYTNAFWVFGGHRLVPTSAILQVLIDKCNALISNYVGESTSRAQMGEMSVTIAAPDPPQGNVVTADGITAYGENVWPLQPPTTINEVLDNITVSVNFRIYMGDLESYIPTLKKH